MKPANWLGMSLVLALASGAPLKAEDAFEPLVPVLHLDVKPTDDKKPPENIAEPKKDDTKPEEKKEEEKKEDEPKEEKWGPPLPEDIKWMENCNFGQWLKKYRI